MKKKNEKKKNETVPSEFQFHLFNNGEFSWELEFPWDLFHQLKNRIFARFDLGKEFPWDLLHQLKIQIFARFDLGKEFP